MRNKNIITSFVILLFCLYAWFEVKDLPDISNIFPQVCIIFLALLSIMLLVQALRMQVVHDEEEKKNLKFVRILTGGIVGYILAIFIIGFALASTLFLGVFGYVFNPVKRKKDLLYSFGIGILATTIFYVVFGMIFNVPLPEGLILEALS